MPTRNSILKRIEPAAWNTISSQSARMELDRGLVLQRPGEAVTAVYFPVTAIVSLSAETMAGESVNVMLVGREGVIGAFEACGSQHSYTSAIVQIPGEAFKMPANVYRQLYGVSENLRIAVHNYIEVLMVESRQYVACNALHPVDNRLARTLLEVRDRSQSDRLSITHHALSQVLGVQRTTVAASITGLQRAGLLRSGRGSIDIVDAQGLEAASCSCRETVAFVRDDIQSRACAPCEAS